MLMYVYDETGSPIAIKYRTSSYAQNTFDVFFFEKNLQGDIVAIYNSSGTKIGTYTYDAWGNFTVTTNSTVTLEKLIVSTYNPFRYRGYYYDTDTALYYLQSRYYNAQWGRFLNADGVGCIGANQDFASFNLFAYCSNNPVMNIDPLGTFNWVNMMWAVAGVVVVTAICVATAGAGAAAIGASATVIAAAKATTATACIVAASVSMADQIVEDGEISDLGKIVMDTLEDGAEATAESIGIVPAAVYKLTTASSSIVFDSIADMDNNISFNDAMARNTQEWLIEQGVTKTIDYLLFPNATDILTNTAKILLPEGE